MSSELQMVMQAIRELGHSVNGLDKRMDSLDSRMDGFEKRMDGFGKRMDGLENTMKSGFESLHKEIEDRYFDVLDKIDLLREDAQNTAMEVQRIKRRVKKAGLQ